MKTKKIIGKLTLKKRTVANLAFDAMKRVQGGRPYTEDCVTVGALGFDSSRRDSCYETCLDTCANHTCILNDCVTDNNIGIGG